MTKPLKKAINPIYIISDSVGGTGLKITAAVLAQFPSLASSEIKRFPFITDSGQIEDILQDAKKEKAIIVSTLVNKKMIAFVDAFSQAENLRHVDLMTNLTSIIEEEYEESSNQEPGALHKLNTDYFNRVSAMEFAVRYDDGKDAKGFQKADLVILGVSRTSKTPLSLYLANQGYKVANLPIIPEAQIPEELFKIPSRKIIGLTTSAETLAKIRQARLASLGLKNTSQYSDQLRIEKELAYAGDLFNQLDIMTINVENRSIEETAVLIEEYYRDTFQQSRPSLF
ncbi:MULTISPECIES: pyruvate, water dikinase regulatory protein [unclassified Jeotgalibaca]|uniref:pyruvate, water dikinase regulatory protein n=1 Tax=unclassified Jeotgalibaca TaxID=2621505 RepID=UPI003FD61B0F